jgi:hypothetical protein
MTARLVCDIAPGHDTYPLDALCEALDTAGVDYDVKTDAEGLPQGYLGVGVEVGEEELDKILDALCGEHDLANLADSYALLECDFDAHSCISTVESILFYAIEQEDA